MKPLRAVYFIFANTVILFLLIVTVTHVALTRYLDYKAATVFRRLPAVVQRNYSHMAPADVADLLKSTATMRYRFAPWIGMKERPTTSRFVNVNELGIRSNGRPLGNISEIQDAVWFFGGSTTFGYGVADQETIPAQLETALGRPVVNFGVASFFSAQENLLLVQILRHGSRPARVVFLDGINESCDTIDDQRADPRFEDLLNLYRWEPMEIVRPVMYVGLKLRDRARTFAGIDRGAPAGDPLVCERHGRQQPLRVVHAQLLAERDLLCRLNGLECTTLVQPFPGLDGRHEDRQSLPEAARPFYRELFAHLEDNWRASKAVFVTDALDHHPTHAFVDGEHYSKAASALIAQAIAGHLHGR